MVEFCSTCGKKNLFGMKQIRTTIELECILDALLAQSIPYVIKRTYFRLLFVGFIQEQEDI